MFLTLDEALGRAICSQALGETFPAGGGFGVENRAGPNC